MASLNDEAPVGAIMNSWKAIRFPECAPPLITLKNGIGKDFPEIPDISLTRW